MTKDEKFVLKLHELAAKLGDIYTPIDRFEVGRAIGQNDRGSYIISRDLAQANFVKKAEGDAVFLTENGLRLVQSLVGKI